MGWSHPINVLSEILSIANFGQISHCRGVRLLKPDTYILCYARSQREQTLHHLETSPDVVDGDETLAIDVDDLEPLDVRLDFVLAEVDGDLVAAGAVHHLAHLVGQEFAGRLDLLLQGEECVRGAPSIFIKCTQLCTTWGLKEFTCSSRTRIIGVRNQV